MKINKKCLVFALVIVWIISLYIFNNYDFMPIIIEFIKTYSISNEAGTMIIFISLWIVRLPILLPGFILIILGGTLFGTTNGFLLSMIGMVLSESLIYIIAKLFSNFNIKNLINKKYNYIEPLIRKYNFRFLALGIICPIAPTDVICFLSSSLGLSYIKYILTIIISNIPIIGLCSYMGINYKESSLSVIILCLTISILALYTMKIWNSLKADYL
ncbi:VTT domain-containing protein [Clostridium sporogenes]|uniref:TVP38/TMEM64 family membrane protein n=1 Tax=Clostridium botulinum TaxID=1491 RepID=A0A6M0SX19_CLOBO|nr:VTT domain-containing protein [Clostridium sporogenes]NFA59683.1 TVP38/TMEM64 family protein [Clostridium botulinum]NFI73186.1 TVP38/TMEM64 family protein [Clostridium sporogenes]NFL73225.1 TVP38/TMEM64 family protein [Clostridium sporogenes]NFM24745.1 TVP38/TMEM64 family protein [Clostridium sporogenes]NFP60598.1 TVP38/TMEM64 family protein [Clostridium sporogenes]